ncbi:hypothetical protein BJ508DRAFT_303958 [Ascobolus immersus RN42]|uniref:BTB domain-containing protein n=1 Tax=Ascobolus immersus RN42 TaxID=1160509 RepID=A0A3N4IDB7_ASCIM|nr:hypothetical protein BJ508DRAFT_303958 [Ascobolus immersus RN42]
MSSYLWRYYLENDAESFQRLLSGNATGGRNASKANRNTPAASTASSTSIGTGINGASSITSTSTTSAKQIPQITITRQILKDTDELGRALIHLAASDSARLPFLRALLQHPAIDLLQQDAESGWTPLHRALYNGNIAGSREIIRAAKRNGIGWEGLMRKDRNGETAFDIFNDTVEHFEKARVGTVATHVRRHLEDDDDSDDDYSDYGAAEHASSDVKVGDEVFTFGSNKNCNLGFGDPDDRQYPEKVVLHLTEEYLGARDTSNSYVKTRSSSEFKRDTEEKFLDALTKFDPIRILDIQMSKLHSALLTTDRHDNLFVCGVGQGGRLGLGDEFGTQFTFKNVADIGDGNSRVEKVSLGLDHTLVVMSNGTVYSWGSNKCGQLGYDTRKDQAEAATSRKREEEPIQSTPRQVTALRKEDIIGVSASRIHSAAWTDSAVYVWGKNEGQLSIVHSDDKDSKSSITLLPRKVTASFLTDESRIRDVVATDKATAILLTTGEVYLLKDYTYGKVTLPQPPLPTLNRVSGALDSLSVFRVQKKRAHSADVSQIKGAGDTIALINRIGEVCVMDLTRSSTSGGGGRKRGGVCPPVQKVWDLRRKHMAVRDVSVDMGGSVIICTESGSVWRRMQRSKAKEAASILASHGSDFTKQEDYKFFRVPGLNRIVSVRSNGFGAFAAIRKDSDIMRQAVTVRERQVLNILSETASRWPPARARLKSAEDDELDDVESDDVASSMYSQSLDIVSVADLRMPVHRFVLAGRIPLFRRLINEALNGRPATHKQQLNITLGKAGRLHVRFQNVTRPAVLHLMCVLYGHAYRECQFGSRVPVGDVLASSLQTPQFSSAYGPKNIDTWFEQDLTRALSDPLFSNLGDAIVDLADGARVRIFSEIFRARSPFFDTLFGGSAQGHWITGRSKKSDSYVERLVHVDLKHVKLDVFKIVALHIYTDKDDGLFDGVKAKSLSEFLDFVLDVLAIANELLLDRLVEICQKMLGAFADIRNIGELLNGVDGCKIPTFRNVAFEYIMSNLDVLLEGQLLEELNDDIMSEFDEHIRYCQTICSPYTRSIQPATIEAKYQEEIEQKRPTELKRKIRFYSDAIRASQQAATDARPPPPSKAQTAPLSSKANLQTPSKPPMKVIERQKSGELMFDMDDDDGRYRKPVLPNQQQRERDEGGCWQKVGQTVTKVVGGLPSPAHSFTPRPSNVANIVGTVAPPTPPSSGSGTKSPTTPSRVPWTQATTTPAKVDLKTVMAEAGSSGKRQSNLTAALAQAGKSPTAQPRTPTKTPARADSVSLVSAAVPSVQQPSFFFAPPPSAPTPPQSQKQRKQAKSAASPKAPGSSSSIPWQAPSPTPIVSIKELLSSPAEIAQMQTKIKPPTFSDQAKGQGYNGAEASLNLSLADILSQQQTEKDIIQGKVLKRSLQEIQEEQEFQAWWDAECERVRLEQEEEENRKSGKAAKKDKANGRKGRGGGGKKKEKEPVAQEAPSGSAAPQKAPRVPKTPNSEASAQAKPKDRRRGGKPAAHANVPEPSGSAPVPSAPAGNDNTPSSGPLRPAVGSSTPGFLKADAPTFTPGQLKVDAPVFTPGMAFTPTQIAPSSPSPAPSKQQQPRKPRDTNNKNHHPHASGPRPGPGSKQGSALTPRPDPQQVEETPSAEKGKESATRRFFNRGPRKPKPQATGGVGASGGGMQSLQAQRPPLHAHSTS